MNWLEITIETTPDSIEDVAARLTASGFADLVIEDQTEFEDFLQENRSCWDYIDEELQKIFKFRLVLNDQIRKATGS